MALPTPAKSYTFSTNNRITYVSLVESTRSFWRLVKNQWKAASGVTVKGSSNGTTAAMDGVDRWTANSDVIRGGNATTAQSWIVLDCANMGGAEILLTFQGSADGSFRVSFSPGGLFTLAGTATHQPTATDEVVLPSGTSYDPTTGANDRIWNTAVATDGTVLWCAMARSGAYQYFCYIGNYVTAVQAPATPDNPVVGYNQSDSVAAGFNAAADYLTAANWRTRANGTAISGYGGGEAYGSNPGIAVNTQTATCELQGGGYLVQPLAIWSETTGARGKVGNLVDLWAGPVLSGHGDTLPNDASRQFIMVGDLMLKWDGTSPVLV